MRRGRVSRFYVYTLSDPRSGDVFYVGKGSGLRMYQHAVEARVSSNGNRAKLDRIRDIQGAGFEPLAAKVAEYDSERDALDHEADLIASLPGLTNIMSGGVCQSLTPEEAARRAIEREATRLARNLEKTAADLRAWLKRVDRWPGVSCPGTRNGDQLAEDIVSAIRSLVAQ